MPRFLPLVVTTAAVASMAVATPASAAVPLPQYVQCYYLIVETTRSEPLFTLCSPFTL